MQAFDSSLETREAPQTAPELSTCRAKTERVRESSWCPHIFLNPGAAQPTNAALQRRIHGAQICSWRRMGSYIWGSICLQLGACTANQQAGSLRLMVDQKTGNLPRQEVLPYFISAGQIRSGFQRGRCSRATAQSKGKSQTCEFGRQNLLTLQCLPFVLTNSISFILCSFSTSLPAFHSHIQKFIVTSLHSSNAHGSQHTQAERAGAAFFWFSR